MALVAQRLGMDRLADRHRRRARALARERPDAAPVEGWDGMTAGRLARLFEEEVEVADAAAARRKEP
jgi:hypothetical protein